jgi:hypothetical protein
VGVQVREMREQTPLVGPFGPVGQVMTLALACQGWEEGIRGCWSRLGFGLMVASVVLILYLTTVPFSKIDAQTKVILFSAKKLEAQLPITKERVLAAAFIRKGMTKKQG